MTRGSRRANGEGGEKERKGGTAVYLSTMSSVYAPHSRGHGQHKSGSKHLGHYGKGINSSLPPRTAKESDLTQDACLDPLDMLDCGSQPLATPLSKDERKICELMADVLCARSALDTRKLFSVLAQKVEGQRLQLSYGGTGCSSSRKAGDDGRFNSLSSEPDEDSSRRNHDNYLADLRARMSAQQERYQKEREAQRQEGLRNVGGKGKQQAYPSLHNGLSSKGEKNRKIFKKLEEGNGTEKESSEPLAGETCEMKPKASPKKSSSGVEDEQVLELLCSPVKTPIGHGNPRNLSSTKEIRFSPLLNTSKQKPSSADIVTPGVNEEGSSTTGVKAVLRSPNSSTSSMIKMGSDHKTVPRPVEHSQTDFESRSSVRPLNEMNKEREKSDQSASLNGDKYTLKRADNIVTDSFSDDEIGFKSSSLANEKNGEKNSSPATISNRSSSNEKDDEMYDNEDFENAASNGDVTPDRASDKTEEKEEEKQEEEEEDKLPWE